MMTRRYRLIAVLMAGSLVVAACGGDDEETTGSGGTSAEGSDSSEPVDVEDGAVEQARAYVEERSAKPTSINIDEPLAGPIPEGKKIVMLECPVPSCKQISAGAKAAAEAAGFEFSAVAIESTPEGFNSGFDTAIQQGADGIFVTGSSAEIIAPSLTKTKNAGIPVVEMSTPDEATGMEGNGIVAVIIGTEQVRDSGEMLANWVVADGGAGPHTVAFVNIGTFPILRPYQEGFEDTLTQLCPDCEVQTLNAQVADIGTKIPGQVVSAVQQNPDIKYAIFGFGSMINGVTAALREAGIEGVRMGAQTPSPPNMQALLDGDEHVIVGQDSALQGWRAIDAFARFFTDSDMTPANEVLLPNQLLTEDNMTEEQVEGYVAFEEYPEQFMELWGVGS